MATSSPVTDLNQRPTSSSNRAGSQRPTVQVVALIVAGLMLIGGGSYLVHRKAFAGAPECRLSVPLSSVDPLVFPRKEGPALLDSAIMDNVEPAVITRLIREQGGFSVVHGTACSELEAGAVYSRVLVTEGPFAGRTVWAPTRYTHGR